MPHLVCTFCVCVCVSGDFNYSDIEFPDILGLTSASDIPTGVLIPTHICYLQTIQR